MPPIKPTSSRDPDLVNRVVASQQRRASESGVGLSRAWNVFKFYRKSQIALRAFSLIGRRFGFDAKSRSAKSLAVDMSSVSIQTRAHSEFETILEIRAATCYRSPDDVRKQLERGAIAVLNQQRPLKWRINEGARVDEEGSPSENDGPSKDKSLLWQFQLHYHEYLLSLAGESRTPDDVRLIQRTIESWLDENLISNRAAHLDAWHPYCISRRLPVWFCLMMLPELEEPLRTRMRESARLQAAFLSKNLEWDLRGNHLLENLRALALAGCFFESAQSVQWLEQVRRILPSQLKEQVLLHGEHFERCPMYHCQILGNLLETLIAANNVDPLLCDIVRPVTAKMFGFLAEAVHPDGEIPLLGDSCFGEAPSVRCLEGLAEAANVECLASESDPEGGVTTIGDYWIYRDQNDYLLFDRGAAGADTLPAHAHCDLMTMESSIGGTRWLVDSGLFGYDDDSMRAYCRSSPAHNVVCVDDQNQFDIWSKFRMGRRGVPGGLAHGRENELSWATASHNAYRGLGIEKVSRLVGIQKNKFWFCLDRVESPLRSSRRLTGFMHLAPEVSVSRVNDCRYQVHFSEYSCDLIFVGTSKTETIESWYCPEFGKRIRNIVFEYTMDPAENLAGWLLVPQLSRNVIDDHHRPALHCDRRQGSNQIAISTPADGVIQTFNWKFNP